MTSLALTLLLLAAPADQRPTHLTYQAPAGCPAQDEFARGLLYRTTRVRLVAAAADATAHVAALITRQGANFSGTLEATTLDGLREHKRFQSRRCDVVVASLSVALALLLDPEGAKLGPLPAQLPPAPPAEPAEPAEPVVPPQPAPDAGALDGPSPDAGAPRPEAPPAPVPVAAPPNPTAAPTPTVAPLVEGALGALAAITTGLSGAVDVAGGIEGELAGARGLVRPVGRVAVSLGSGRTLTSAAGSVAYGPHGHLEALGGVRLLDGLLRPELGLALDTFFMEVRALTATENRPSLRALPALGGYARLALHVGAWTVSLRASVCAHLLQERYRIEPDGDVFGVPTLHVSTALVFARTWPAPSN